MKFITSILMSLLFTQIGYCVLSVNTDILGGNATVQKIDGNEIFLQPDLRDTSGWWFYWCFEVNGASGKEITVNFLQHDAVEANGPAYSFDDGKTWNWLGEASVIRKKDGASFKHKIPAYVKSVIYALAYPYGLENFLSAAKNWQTPELNFKIKPLAVTKLGRQNILAMFGNPNAKFKIALTARHHACESSASYVLEGFINELASDSETAKWLRSNAEFFVVPFADLDGVQNGDQGKNRRPHDHNRDYIEEIYPTIAAIKKELLKFVDNNPLIALDLHAPYIGNYKGKNPNRTVFFVHCNDKKQSENLEKLSTYLQSITTSTKTDIAHFSKDNHPFGKTWNNLTTPTSFKEWAASLKNTEIAATMETAYSDANGTPATDVALRKLGKNLAKALEAYLKETK